MKKIQEHIELTLGVDARSVGVFRIMIGVIILYDLIVRVFSIEAHYTDQGVVSRQVLRGISENPLLLSLNVLSGELYVQWLIFVIAAIAAVCLIIGFRSQLSCMVCLITMLSIQVRNPFINNLGDWFLLHLLFWGALLPLGARFSVDSMKKNKRISTHNQVLSIASLGVIIQIASLYFFSVFRKISPIWHTEGTAIHYALSLDRLVTSVGEWALTLPYEWLTFLTAATLILERWGPILLFVPLFNTPIRLAVIICFVLFHTGLALTLELGIFPFVCICAWLILLPKGFWVRIIALFTRSVSKSSNLRRDLYRSEDIPEPISIGFVANVLVSTVLLFVVVSSNLLYAEKMSVAYYEGLYKYVEPLVNSLNLRQRWNMFSPHPAKQDGWVLVIGVMEDGTMIDLDSPSARVSWERPLDISATYRDQRWRKYMEYVTRRWDPHARLLGEYYLSSDTYREAGISKVIVCFMGEYAVGPYESSRVHLRILKEVERRED